MKQYEVSISYRVRVFAEDEEDAVNEAWIAIDNNNDPCVKIEEVEE